jgi:uncharacterized protein YkwD
MLQNMRRHIKDYFIPHQGNDHKPHMVRDASIIVLLATVVLVFGFSIFQALLIKTSTEFTASVLPAVLVDLANKDRESQGLVDLEVNSVLEEAARMKAEDMVANEYFAHTSPAGLNPWYWFYRAGYNFMHAGENLAVNFVDSGDVEQAWMNSPGHRANILDGKFTQVGIAAIPGTYKGKKTIYVVQLFGTPIPETATAVQVDSTPVASAVAPAPAPQVAGEQTEVVPSPEMTRDVVVAQEFVPSENQPAQNVVGAASEETQVAVAVETAPQANPWQKFLTQPRAIVRAVYVTLGLLLAFVMALMVWHEVHRRHAREFLHAIALLLVIVLLSYFNYVLLSAGLVVV